MEHREPTFVHTHSLVIPKGDNTPEIDITVTIREGATPEMIVETLNHYCIAVKTLWSGDELGNDQYNRVRHDYGDTPHGEARVCCYGKAWMLLPSGKRRSVQINKCTEVTTAYDLARSIRESIATLHDFYKLVTERRVAEVATEPQPATLRITTQDELNAYVEKHPYDDVTDMPNIKLRPSRQRVAPSDFSVSNVEGHEILRTFGDLD